LTVTLKNTLLALLAIAFVTLFPHTGLIPLPFGYTVPVLLVIWWYLKSTGHKFSHTGFRFRDLTGKAVLTGAVAGLLIFLFLSKVFFPLLSQLVSLPATQVEMYDQLRGNTGFYSFLLIMGWLVGGLYEEIVFHGFLFREIEKLLPGRNAVLLSFLLSNIIFGAYHLQLGYEGAINALLAGMGYNAVILLNRRNLWYGIIAHGVFDTIALTMLYMGQY
jgi:membrane protease YdiL (CAAX protease family)